MVSMFTEKPSAASTPNVPSSTTGTAIVGINVARKFCRNRYITRNTSAIASSRVTLTPLLDTSTKGVVSHARPHLSPGGNTGPSPAHAPPTPPPPSRPPAPRHPPPPPPAPHTPP